VVDNNPPPYIEIRQDTPRGLYLIYMYYVGIVYNICVSIWRIPPTSLPPLAAAPPTPHALNLSFSNPGLKSFFLTEKKLRHVGCLLSFERPAFVLKTNDYG
jgi:hypothetical protein